MKIGYYTLGCKVNQYETEAIREALARRGFESVDFEAFADAYIINTCTVTAMSDKKSRQMVRRARRTNPQALIGVIGCYVQKNENPAALADADFLIGTRDKGQIVELIAAALQKKASAGGNTLPPASCSPPDAPSQSCENSAQQLADAKTTPGQRSLAGAPYERMRICSFQSHTRAFVKVEDGCDNFCAYCIIPYVRGRARSRAMADILEEVEALCDSGYQEIVLTGIHEASYGKDLEGVTFLDLIKKVAQNGKIKRLRLGSLEPVVADAHFVREIAKIPALCDQFHLSLQSGCDQTLSRMGRRYTSAQYADCVKNLRACFPDAAITTDVIVGFPGEDEAEFAATCAFVDQIGFAKVHLFPFSAREGTRAYTMPGQISKKVKQERLHRLEQIAQKHAAAFLQAHSGKVMPVLFEREADGCWEGLTSNYLRVKVKASQPLAGQIVPVRITSAAGESCCGEMV